MSTTIPNAKIETAKSKAAKIEQDATIESLANYDYGWSDDNDAGTNARRGINEEVVRDISAKKSEPQWMLDLRLKGLRLFEKKPQR